MDFRQSKNINIKIVIRDHIIIKKFIECMEYGAVWWRNSSSVVTQQ